MKSRPTLPPEAGSGALKRTPQIRVESEHG
jgi:hypothetical protein